VDGASQMSPISTFSSPNIDICPALRFFPVEFPLLLVTCTLSAGAKDKKRQCQCPVCHKKKEAIAKQKATIQPTVIKICLAVGWVIFVLLAWKVSMIQLDYVEYDPFNELGIDRVCVQCYFC
ncbi:translocation protein SEC63-like protein, partial [Elysia marginata]